MPELPEVETIRTDLHEKVVGRHIVDVRFFWDGILKEMPTRDFIKIVKGKKIIDVKRRAKSLYIVLSENLNLLMHMKMTGHLIVVGEEWEIDNSGRWKAKKGQISPLTDPLNQFIRASFHLDNGEQIAFSDLRKFAYVKLLDDKSLAIFLDKYGPEPLNEDFDLKRLEEILKNKKVAIKKVLMDPKNIAGIGNIYADEILWASKIHPLTKPICLNRKEIKELFSNIKRVLGKAVEMRGTSTSDFRDTEGRKGEYGGALKVYRRTGEPCERDGHPIERITVGGRGTHYCPICQVLKDV